eukprot:8230498-Alexandrium_andersonii.AAC.1
MLRSPTRWPPIARPGRDVNARTTARLSSGGTYTLRMAQSAAPGASSPLPPAGPRRILTSKQQPGTCS